MVLVCDQQSIVWGSSTRLKIVIIEILLRLLWCSRRVPCSAEMRFLVRVTTITSGESDNLEVASVLHWEGMEWRSRGSSANCITGKHNEQGLEYKNNEVVLGSHVIRRLFIMRVWTEILGRGEAYRVSGPERQCAPLVLFTGIHRAISHFTSLTVSNLWKMAIPNGYGTDEGENRTTDTCPSFRRFPRA